MADFTYVVCSHIDFMTITSMLLTLVGAVIITFLIVKYNAFDQVPYVKLSLITSCVIVFFLLFDTICVYPNAKAAIVTSTAAIETDINSLIECRVPRMAEVDILQRDLQRPGYFLLEGLHGSGKTTLLQMAMQSFNESSTPHLYVWISYDGNVAKDLYRSLKIQDYCDSTWVTIRSYIGIQTDVCRRQEPLEYAIKVLKKVCSDIHDETGNPPLIIFDNTALILKEKNGKGIISDLQDMAKEAVDRGGYMKVLFLSSESSVPTILRSRSAKSRMRSTTYVGDISDEEAIEYITCMCNNASKELVTQVVHYFGGRFIHLRQAAADVNTYGSAGLQDTINLMYKELSVLTGSLPLEVLQKLENVVKNITQSPTKSITHSDYISIQKTGLSQEDRDLIEKMNILNSNQRDFSVSFASRIVERFFKEYYEYTV